MPGAGEGGVRRREAHGEHGLDHQPGGLRVGLLWLRLRVGVGAPAAVGILPGGKERECTGFDRGRQRALCTEPLDDEGGRLIVGSHEARGIVGTPSSVGLVREHPAAIRALLGGQPADRGRIGRLANGLERGEHETLVVRPDEEVAQLLLVPEQPRVGSGGLLRRQQPGDEVGPAEVGRVDTHGVGIEYQVGQLARSVGIVNGDVRVGVGLHVRQSGLRSRCIDVSGGKRQDGVDGVREGAADAPVGGLLARDPRCGRLRHGELRDLRLYRRGAGGHRE